MTKIFKNSQLFLAIVITILRGEVSFGQENYNNPMTFKENESFLTLPEGVIKNEIASFSIKALNSKESLSKVNLNEVPLRRCSDSTAFFEKGNIYASEIIVSIASENIAQKAQIKKVFFIHYKYGFSLPDSAINDIYDPNICAEYTKKNKPIASNCKVYQSVDRKRIYIYMLNGQVDRCYEVTWVIKDDEYYTRVIDRIK